MKIIRTTQFQIALSDADRKQLSSKTRIKQALTDPNILSYDIWDGDARIGFAMLRPFNENGFFLWNFAIDSAYQNQHYGPRALRGLFTMLKQEHHAKVITTTYTFGNDHAKYVYEKVGFRETDVVEENGIHEVNMVVEL
jgi:RimJ/RimL family protein N-acetyltransferase